MLQYTSNQFVALHVSTAAVLRSVCSIVQFNCMYSHKLLVDAQINQISTIERLAGCRTRRRQKMMSLRYLFTVLSYLSSRPACHRTTVHFQNHRLVLGRLPAYHKSNEKNMNIPNIPMVVPVTICSNTFGADSM